MEENTGDRQGKRSRLREWIDPTRLYDPRRPAGRLVFFWGLAIYPLLTVYLLLAIVIIVVESASAGAHTADDLGIATWVFMLAWVAAMVAICRRRLLQLGKSQAWIWLAILPVINLGLFLYLSLKPDPDASH